MFIKSGLLRHHTLTIPFFILLSFMLNSLAWRFATAATVLPFSRPCNTKDLPTDASWTDTCSLSGDIAKDQRLRELEREILDKLGLQKPPNITKLQNPRNISALLDMLEFAKEQVEDHNVESVDENYRFKPYNRIIYGQHLNYVKKDHFINKIGGTYFDLNGWNGPNVYLDRAILRVFLRKRRLANETSVSSNNTAAKVSIGIIAPPDAKQSTQDNQEVAPRTNPFSIDSEELSYKLTSNGFWISLNVKRLVNRWIGNDMNNHGIILEARLHNDSHGDNYAITPQNAQPNEEHLTPYLELIQRPPGRLRRSLHGNCQEGTNETQCCRYPLTVQMEKLMASNFIVWPQSFDAYYCRGMCGDGGGSQQSLQNHFAARSKRPEERTKYPKLCCSASTKSDLFIVYQNEQNDFIGGTLPGVIVQRCSCN